MSETYMFGYIFSKETTEKILDGEAFLGAGGAKRKDGTMLELARPVMLNKETSDENDSNAIDQKLNAIAKEMNDYSSLSTELRLSNQESRDLIKQSCAINAEGFRVVLEGVNQIASHLATMEQKNDYHLSKDMAQVLQNLINYLRSDAGKLEAPKFDVTNSMVSDHLDDAAAFLKRLYSDVSSEAYYWNIEIEIMLQLLSPFSYVMNRYSAQYYYDNMLYPSNYDEWIGVLKRIVTDSRIYEKWLYTLRVNHGCSFERGTRITALQRENNRQLRQGAAALKEFVLSHSKEEYLSIPQMQFEKYKNNEYKLIEGCMYLPLD